MEGPRYLWRQLNSREHVILSKRRTGSKREERDLEGGGREGEGEGDGGDAWEGRAHV